MRIAVIYNEKDIFLEYDTNTFKGLLEKYYKQYNDISKALDCIERDLKKEVLRK